MNPLADRRHVSHSLSMRDRNLVARRLMSIVLVGAEIRTAAGKPISGGTLVIRDGRVEAVGYGDQHPVASNDTDEGRQRNRRIEAAEL